MIPPHEGPRAFAIRAAGDAPGAGAGGWPRGETAGAQGEAPGAAAGPWAGAGSAGAPPPSIPHGGHDPFPGDPLGQRVLAALREVYDPEIPVNIYDLGLVYDLSLDAAARSVHVRMTLTAPGCPVAGTLPPHVEQKLAALDGIDRATVELVWDPPWTRERMSERAKLELGFL